MIPLTECSTRDYTYVWRWSSQQWNFWGWGCQRCVFSSRTPEVFYQHLPKCLGVNPDPDQD